MRSSETMAICLFCDLCVYSIIVGTYSRLALSSERIESYGALRDVRAETLALTNVARGTEWNLEDGFYRLVVDAKTDAMVGATLVGYEAGEIVHVIAFGIECGATWRDLDRFVAIHPTFCEGLPSLARLFETGG